MRVRPSSALIATAVIVSISACSGSKAATVDTTAIPSTVATTAAPTTAAASSTTAAPTTAAPTTVARTTAAPTTAAKAATTAPAATSGAAPIASLADAFYPKDLSALLKGLGFPSWWPVADAVETDATKPATVLKIETRLDGMVKPGDITRNTTYATSDADPATAADAWVAKLGGGADVAALKANKNSGTDNGVDFTRYRGKATDGSTLSVTAAKSTKTDGDQRVVVAVEQTLKGPFDSNVIPGLPARVLDALPKVDGYAPIATTLLMSTSFGFGGTYDVKLSGPKGSWPALRAALTDYAGRIGAKPGTDAANFFASNGVVDEFDVTISSIEPKPDSTLDPYVTFTFRLPSP